MVSSKSIRFQLLLSTAVAASLALPGKAAAQNVPEGGAFIRGSGTITPPGAGETTETVALGTNRSVINWNSFDIAQTYTVNFTGPNGAAVLNRVVTPDVSNIDGTLMSNPSIEVFLINPNGIIFGQHAVVNVGSFLASTLDLDSDEFINGGTADPPPPNDPNHYFHFRGVPGNPNAQVSTGIEVQNGAQINSLTGPITLLGAFVHVDAGGSVKAATDVGMVAGNSIEVPADAGSRISFFIGRASPSSDVITIAGKVSGRNVTAVGATAPDAQDALLLVDNTGVITAKTAGGGNIVLDILGVQNDGTIAHSSGGVRNNGTLDAAGRVVLSGGLERVTGARVPPSFVENNGTISAGSDVIMRATQEITNAGTIKAGGDVTLSAIGTATSSVPDVQITNSGKIIADGDVNLLANAEVSGTSSIILFAALAPALASSPHVQLTNTGTIKAGGNVNLSAAVDISNLASDTIELNPSLRVMNDGNITAGGNVTLSGTIDVFNVAASSGIDVVAQGSVINNGPITAGGDVNLNGAIDVFNLGGTDTAPDQINVLADLQIANSGTITADGDVNVSGDVEIFNLEADNIDAIANLQIVNAGTIAASGNVNIDATIDIFNAALSSSSSSSGFHAVGGSSISAIANFDLTNSGLISAGGDVSITPDVEIFNLAADHIDAVADLEVVNAGTIAASGNVNISASVDIFNAALSSSFSSSGFHAVGASRISANANFDLTNSGLISAGGDVSITPDVEIFNLAASEIAADANLNLQNDGTIAADGNVTIAATIDLFNLAGSTSFFSAIAPASVTAGANLAIANNGLISAGGDADVKADISLSDITQGKMEATANLNVTNRGTISADGNVDIAAAISLFSVTALPTPLFALVTVTAAANVQITNTGKISAGGDASITAAVSGSEIFANVMGVSADVQIDNAGVITAGGNVFVSGIIDFSNLSASHIQADASVNETNAGSITAGGDVHLFGSVATASLGTAASEAVHIANSGKINAGGDVFFTAEAFGSGPAPTVDIVNSGTIAAAGNVLFFANTGDITNSGAISASGDVSLFADNGNITNIGSISAAGSFTAEASNGNIINSGTIDAGGNAFLNADGNIINSGVIDAGGVADLEAGNDIDNSGSVVAGGNAILNAGHDIDNTGAVSAGGDAILTAINDILDSSGTFAGTISGVDVALSAGGSITAGSVTARDDIAIRAGGTVTAGSLISGATINGQGPVDVVGAADELLPGVDLSGNDIDVDGTAIAVDVVHALGAGSDIRLRKPVTSSRDDLDFFAGGDITIDGSASAVDVAMDAGGTITAGDISARDDIALRAGNTLNVGILQSGVTIDGAGPVDQDGSADALLGQNLAGHDLFVQGGTVNLSKAIANGTGSDLTVRATTGGLTIADGEAGGMITLIKQGATGILTAGTLLAGTGASLTSDTDIDAQTVQTLTGDLAFKAARDVTVHSSLIGDDVAISAGRNVTTGDISARDDIAIIAGGTLNTGTLASGVAIGGRGPLDTAGAADALLAGQDLTGHDLYVQASSVSLASATANGAGSDLTARATTGNLTIENGVAGGNVNLDGAFLVTVGTVTAQTGNVNILADDLDIVTSISGQQVSITNRAGGTDVTVLGDASALNAFTLTGEEINRIHTATLTIDSLDQNLLVGNVTFANDVGSSRINLLGTARVDIVGAIDGSGVTRTLQIGGTLDPADPNDPATLASIIRIAATSTGGGRIILRDDGTLDLRGVKIGVGLDDGFLQPLGLTEGGTPASTDVVQKDWIGNPGSTLYGIPGGYANPVIISAGTINVTYTDYALFQNTGSRRKPSGVNAGVLNIFSSGADGNGFEMFGTIDQIGGIGAAFLVNPTEVSLGNSRINGCLILTGGGCLDQIGPGGGGGGGIIDIIDPGLPPPPGSGDPDEVGKLGGAGGEFAEQDLVSSGDDNAFDFDSLVGTNNEGLLGVLGVDDACAPDDKRDTCKVKEKANEQ